MMWVKTKLEEYLNESAKNNSCTIVLTDLKKIIFSSDKKYSTQPISKELLRVLLDFSLSVPTRQVINNENNILPIYEAEKNTTDTNYNQIIMPLYHAYKLSGLIIILFSESTFEKNLTLAKMIRTFTEKHINGVFIENMLLLENESTLFSEDYINNVTEILESNMRSLRKNESYVIKSKNLNDDIKIFENKLGDKEKESFDEILSQLYVIAEYERALLYSIGIKYGIELAKI